VGQAAGSALILMILKQVQNNLLENKQENKGIFRV
jgi:hypothetical protein